MLDEFEVHHRKSLDCLKEIVGRNIDIKRDSNESSERKEGRCKKASVFLEYLIMTRVLIEICRDSKGHSAEV